MVPHGMIVFFVLMALACAWLSVQLQDRWLAVNAWLFVGLAFTPLIGGSALLLWWVVVGLMAWWMAVRYFPRAWREPAPLPQSAHYAVCRWYHSSAASEGRE